MRRNELLIKTKARRLLVDVVYPVVENFPRSETHALSLHIKNAFLDFMCHVDTANAYKNNRSKRREHQELADAQLKRILNLFDIANERRYITNKKLLQLQTSLQEIGRILGGWMKNS